jgi:hypothetical protein
MLHIYGNYNSSSTPLNYHEQERQASRSQYQLYRYNHEPVSSNLLRRDIPPILILLFFLFLIVIILSQILVVHTSRYGANFSAMQKIQEELKQMDDSMEALLRDNVLPIDKWRLLFHIQTYLYRFEYLFNSFNNESSLIRNNDLNQTITKIHRKHADNQLKATMDKDEDSQWKRRKIKNKRKRNYCKEEPLHLRKF